MEALISNRAALFTAGELWTLVDALDALDDQSSWDAHGESLHDEFAAEAERRVAERKS